MVATTLETRRCRAATAGLVVERTGITWRNVAPDRVRIGVTVENHGDERSQPTGMVIQAAAFGAFVPWRPLTTEEVPEIEPGGSVTVETEVSVEQLDPPDGPVNDRRRQPERLPGRQWPVNRLEKLFSQRPGSPFETGLPADTAPLAAARQAALRRLWSTREAGLPADTAPLAAAVSARWGLQGGGHWVGNLNVFIGDRAVERHQAQSLRVYPGVRNRALFMVGSGPDAYAFRLEGDAAAWDSRLIAGHWFRSAKAGSRPLIFEGEWFETHRMQMVVLTVHPPEECSEGEVEVHVTQRSTGEVAIVEFSLDPNAAGPGCYTV